MANIKLIGVPIQEGASQEGCVMGPAAYRTAQIMPMLSELNLNVEDLGDLNMVPDESATSSNKAVHDLAAVVGWVKAIQKFGTKLSNDDIPVFLGGDHAMAMGTLSAMAARAKRASKNQYVLWLDAHSDFHTMLTTESGNLHGTPVAYATGQSGFETAFPKLDAIIEPAHVCMIGIRSVDQAEHARIMKTDIEVNDMRRIDEFGVVTILRNFIEIVKNNDGMLHISLDVDFLEPVIAPAVGTTVPGGATFREAHLIMEMLYDSGLVTSVDLAELNPFLDERGRTANLMVDLVCSLFGRRVIDRKTHAF